MRLSVIPAGISIAASAALALAPASANAAPVSDVPANKIVSQASASALTVSLGGQKVGSGEYVAENDGTKKHLRGRNSPLVPLLDGQRDIVGGALGQDADATADGRSTACAGLVGRNGSVEVGKHNSCLTSRTNNGEIELSLGSLENLGLKGVPELPKLPVELGTLPDLELKIVGRALTAKCFARSSTAGSARGAGKVVGSSTPLDAEIVAVVDGKRIPIAKIPPAGGSVDLEDIIEKLKGGLPAGLEELEKLLGPLKDVEVPSNDLLQIVPNEQISDQGRLTVTALRVKAAAPSLADIGVGTVSCGPNKSKTVARTPTKPKPAPTTTSKVPTKVPAGLESAPVGSGEPLGWQTMLPLGLIALIVGAFIHRQGSIHRERGHSRGHD